jgi:predicted Holliday junction resolvase-like endonuclease
MSNLITVIVIGGYTIIYLVVFIIQKSQLDKVKEINSSMKSYMDIFKIDEVKKYVELKTERITLEALKLIHDDAKVKKIMEEAVKESTEAIKGIYINQMGEYYLELVSLAVNVLLSQPEDKRIDFVKKALPRTGNGLLKLIDAKDKGDIKDLFKEIKV